MKTNIKQGVNLRMTATYRDDEAETSISDGMDQPMNEKLDAQMITGHDMRHNKTSKYMKEDKLKVTRTKMSQIVDAQQRKTQTMAIPFGITSPTKYLPCTVIDRRLHESKGVQYKVMFSDERLIKMRMKKQWISADKLSLCDVEGREEDSETGAKNSLHTSEFYVNNLNENKARLRDKRKCQYDHGEPPSTKVRRFSYIIDPITVKSRIIL